MPRKVFATLGFGTKDAGQGTGPSLPVLCPFFLRLFSNLYSIRY